MSTTIETEIYLNSLSDDILFIDISCEGIKSLPDFPVSSSEKSEESLPSMPSISSEKELEKSYTQIKDELEKINKDLSDLRFVVLSCCENMH